jgi:hypothetical protein
MTTLIIKTNASQATDVLLKDLGFIVPNSGGSVTFTDILNLQDCNTSTNLRTYATDDAYGVNSSTLILNNGVSDVVQSQVNNFLSTIAGTQGATGLSGITGVVGTTGVFSNQTGILGFTGLQDGTGIQGLTGLQDGTGIQGLTGLQDGTGIQGLTGLQDGTGIRGITGLQDGTGIQGLTGILDGTGIRGLTGFQQTGLDGVTGIFTITGIRGITGLRSTGIFGITGANGLNNTSTGIIGFAPTGLQSGMTGVQGVTGIKGITGLDFGATIIGATGTITTGNTAYPAFASTGVGFQMALIPPAGTYVVLFSTSVTQNTATATVFATIYLAGAQVINAQRAWMSGTGTATGNLSTEAIVTVNGTQIVDVRWRVDAGTGTMNQKNMIFMQVYI